MSASSGAGAGSRHLELSLFGQKLYLKHSTDDPELAIEAAELVSRKVKEAQARAPKGTAPHQVAVIALLELAAEYLQAKARTEDYQREIERKSSELMGWIGTELK